ncbi:phosphoribosylglycinamide formyltransferase [Colwellia sp. 4_MG-2023]|jgi:phosphoribosylglycinamide formyltransferase-1|uniref:phosphoribosylglycinamide formyltransferase n=1 Tax=unclassified Colwellia TaxID=196834 RepID=UPI001C08502E|nr:MULTISPECIES: phosphoribosylglycinamide formyltransferase [unclassified Colwellia]MBU2924765.1 phosphoribosylglycinamide formyltransferase [Colwellia sp. C2M11]MDO6489547.1 phosphoribosylglycinamide formyltransferase [Colwellia sp. 6_MG-2023]MDO6508630.1 phosphoribosylglycinamide formyltransferase [Colwellia sp. 5_MG-2023]MDO6557259.1 phosphoribosylglycinamide formyltransferase [Colwellia sp. 4_MG-2023]MDO6653838.1 phosphoribosylglycinamide formyltransferase [Colwellia sp. 3_MG-2023]
MSSRIVVLISGQGSNLQAIIDACKLTDYPGSVVGVISNKLDAYGLTRAKDAGIETVALSHQKFESREDYDQALITQIDLFAPDIIVLAGFMRILTPAFVKYYQGKLINIHPSLLPKYQGLHTHQRAIDAGDKEHGVSVHFVTETLDGGPVILQAKVPVFDGDTSDDLAARVHEQEHRIYPLVVKWLCQNRLRMETKDKSEVAILDNNILPISGYANDE